MKSKTRLTGAMKAWYKYEAQVFYARVRKYKLRKALLATTCLVLALLPPLWAVEPVIPEVQKVFKVVARTGDGKTTYTATAFYVSPTTLATAAHTFKKTADQWIVKDGREVHCRLAKIDHKLDLALLECEEANAEHYRLVAEVTVIGFAYGKAMESNKGGLERGLVCARVRFVPGMSGGPVVNQYGDVEGLGVENDFAGKGVVCKFVPASVLAAFLAKK